MHCIGIGGIGVSAVAKFFVLSGAHVTGSDIAESDILQELRAMGIQISLGHSADNVPRDCELIIYTAAITENNPELVQAKLQNVRCMLYAEVLGAISKTRRTIAVTGMHGKSTTTAMLGCIFKKQDPLVIVGSKYKGFSHGNLHFTALRDTPFIVEADEYRAHMNYLRPQEIIVTNIDEEHLDFYRDIGHIVSSFQNFINMMPPAGNLYINAENPHASTLKSSGRVITFGTHALADFRAFPGVFSSGMRKIGVELRKEPLGKFCLRVPGMHNVHNAMAALSCAISNNISFHAAADALSQFTGLWRRSELVGEWCGVPIISDYGHHPTEIAATIAGVREMYPKKRIVLLYEPHQYDRTKKLFNGFVGALPLADHTIITDIFDVVGREDARDASSRELAEACGAAHVEYGGALEHAFIALKKIIQKDDCVIVMGAGTIDTFARTLVQSSI